MLLLELIEKKKQEQVPPMLRRQSYDGKKPHFNKKKTPEFLKPQSGT